MTVGGTVLDYVAQFEVGLLSTDDLPSTCGKDKALQQFMEFQTNETNEFDKGRMALFPLLFKLKEQLVICELDQCNAFNPYYKRYAMVFF